MQAYGAQIHVDTNILGQITKYNSVIVTPKSLLLLVGKIFQIY
jgi:hypothetical protein